MNKFLFSGLLIITLVIPLAARGDYRATPYYLSVATSDYIRVEGEGIIEVDYASARFLFEQDNILDVVQQAYAALLKPGEKPEFEVVQESPRHWSYVNKKGHHSAIVELIRKLDDDGTAHLVFYSEGERFFGDFRAVIEIGVTANSAENCRYEVTVMAFPLNSFSRFFARHLGIVERFFHSKTKEITDLTVSICHFLLHREPGNRNG